MCIYIEPLELPTCEGSEKEARRKAWGRVRRASGQDGVPRKKYSTGQKQLKDQAEGLRSAQWI